MSLSSSSSLSNLQCIKDQFFECLSDIGGTLASMDELVEALEAGTSSDVDSTVATLNELLVELEESLESLADILKLPPDYEDPPVEEACSNEDPIEWDLHHH